MTDAEQFEDSMKADDSAAALKCSDECASRLFEHFDTVLIICTKHVGTRTSIYSTGKGNCYAQSGSVREWLTNQEEHMREQARKEHDNG